MADAAEAYHRAVAQARHDATVGAICDAAAQRLINQAEQDYVVAEAEANLVYVETTAPQDLARTTAVAGADFTWTRTNENGWRDFLIVQAKAVSARQIREATLEAGFRTREAASYADAVAALAAASGWPWALRLAEQAAARATQVAAVQAQNVAKTTAESTARRDEAIRRAIAAAERAIAEAKAERDKQIARAKAACDAAVRGAQDALVLALLGGVVPDELPAMYSDLPENLPGTITAASADDYHAASHRDGKYREAVDAMFTTGSPIGSPNPYNPWEVWFYTNYVGNAVATRRLVGDQLQERLIRSKPTPITLDTDKLQFGGIIQFPDLGLPGGGSTPTDRWTDYKSSITAAGVSANATNSHTRATFAELQKQAPEVAAQVEATAPNAQTTTGEAAGPEGGGEPASNNAPPATPSTLGAIVNAILSVIADMPIIIVELHPTLAEGNAELDAEKATREDGAEAQTSELSLTQDQIGELSGAIHRLGNVRNRVWTQVIKAMEAQESSWFFKDDYAERALQAVRQAVELDEKIEEVRLFLLEHPELLRHLFPHSPRVGANLESRGKFNREIRILGAGVQFRNHSIESCWNPMELVFVATAQPAIMAVRIVPVPAGTSQATSSLVPPVLSGAALLRQKCAHLSPAARQARIAELRAAQKLRNLEQSAAPGAHFYARHGAQTTIEQQYIRSTTATTPDGVVMKTLTDSGRFFTHQDQLFAFHKAIAHFVKTGKSTFTIDLGRPIGEGFTKYGAEWVVTTNVKAVFKAGKLLTLYPKLSSLKATP